MVVVGWFGAVFGLVGGLVAVVVERPVISMPGIAMAVVVVAVISCLAGLVPWVAVGRGVWGIGWGMR